MKPHTNSHGFLAKLHERLFSFHQDQGGAVALLCFAALLILFMVGLVVYDSGLVARTKVDVQMSADTAAYSSAAVKARSMNMIAYGNIGKRTAAGIQNMFVFQPLFYFIWWAGQCSRCCCGVFCGCWTACFNCAGNLIAGLLPFKALIEFAKVLRKDDLEKNMDQIGKFQKDLVEYSSYWALGEAMVRGFRNEAHAVGSFPEPKNQNFGKLPVKNSNSSLGSCLFPFISRSPTTLGTLAEWNANFQNLKKRSTSKPNIARKGPREVVNIGYSLLGCLIAPKEGAPYILSSNNPNRDHNHWFQRSNFLISYRHMGELSRELRDNYDAVTTTAQTEGQGFLSNFGGSGVWAMARSEFYFPEDSLPSPMLSRGGGDAYVYLYHPGWLGKLRPVSLPGERPPSQYGDQMMSKGYDEAARLMFSKPDFLELFNNINFLGYMKDRQFGKKAFKGMDGKVGGKQAFDGLGK